MSGDLDAILESGLVGLGEELTPDARRRQLDFLALLAKWNRVYNLTAVNDRREMVARHLLDSLTLLPLLRGPNVLDAGTGAGLPGIPLAIARPDLTFWLVDGSGKRIRFLRQVMRELGLKNIRPIQSRLEDLTLDEAPDDIVARALAPLPRLVELVEPWLKGSARLLAMKGRPDPAELDLGPGYAVERMDMQLPGDSAERCVVLVSKNENRE